MEDDTKMENLSGGSLDAASGIRTHDLQMSQILAPHMLVKPYESGALTKLGYRSSHNVHNKNAGEPDKDSVRRLS